MNKRAALSIVVLCLLARWSHGQAYSSLALQNSPGSYARAIPYAQLTLCLSTDTAVPCTQKAAIFTDDSLTTRCTATNSSGTLTNAPISGANCNNPGISDANGNFTIYALAGNYRLCTFGQTTLCQEITVGGGGTGNITCPGANSGALAAWLNSTTVGCTNLAYTDFLGGLFSQFYQALGPVNGEVKLTTVGVVPTLALPANTVSWVAPNLVPTSLRMNVPGIECTDGQVWQQLSHGADPTGTENVYMNCLTVAGGLIVFQTNSVANSNQALLNFLNSSANCGFTVTASNTSGGIEQLGFSGSTLTGTCLPAQYRKLRCETGLGDGLNAMTAGTYLQYFCVNDSGVTWTITGIHCWTDNAGTSTLNAANNAATALLTGAVTCNNTKASGGAAGTQSGTTTLANGDAVSFTFVADGTSKQTTWTVSMTQ